MSATSPDIRRPGTLSARPSLSARALSSTPLKAFFASRLLVLPAGIAGALAVPRVTGWSGFDPTRITASLGSVGNVLAASAVRWDSVHYLAIAQHGYHTLESTRFFPLYPLLTRALSPLFGSAVLAGVLVSVGAFIAALIILHRLTELELGRPAADATVLLLCFAPLSFFFTALYTESLFLALSVGAFYAARRQRMALAAVLGALAALTRISGVLLVVPIVWAWVGARPRVVRKAAWAVGPLAGLLAFLVFLAASGYSLLAPFDGQVAQNQHQLTGPITSLTGAVSAASGGARALIAGAEPFYQGDVAGVLGPGAESIVLLGVLSLAVIALVAVVRRLPRAYGVYAALSLLVCVWSPVSGQPLKSLDRYTLTIFPLWMVAGAWLTERRLLRPAVVIGGALLAFYTFQFATWSFVA